MEKGENEKERELIKEMEILGIGYQWGGYKRIEIEVKIGERKVQKKDYEGEVIRIKIGMEEVKEIIEDIERGFDEI